MAETTYTLPTPTTPDDENEVQSKPMMMMTDLEIDTDHEELDIMHTLSAKITDETEEPMIHTDSEIDNEKSTITLSIKQFQKFIVSLDDETPEIKSLEQQKEIVMNIQKSDRRVSLFFIIIATVILPVGLLVCADIIRFGLAIGIAITAAAFVGFIAARFYCYRSREENTWKYASDIYQTVTGDALYFDEDDKKIKVCQYNIDYGYDDCFHGQKLQMALIHEPVVKITQKEIICKFENVTYIKYDTINRGYGETYFINICYETANINGEVDPEKEWKSEYIKDHTKFNALCDRLENVMKNVDPEWWNKVDITRNY